MDIVFFFKKLVGNLLSPLPIVVLLMIYSCYLLHKQKHIKQIKRTIYTATLILIITSSTLIANQLLRPLEELYPVYNDHLETVDNIVVLGCYNRNDKARPKLDNIHDCSMSRMVEAIRLSIVYPEANIIVSGGDKPKDADLPHGEVVKNALISLGVKGSRILAVNGSKDTREESINLRSYLLGKENLLLSEATHLKRAVALFNAQNVKVVPVPSRYMTSSENDFNVYNITPNANAVKTFERLIYETLGNAWVAIRQF